MRRMPRFLRQDTTRHHRLGRKRKSLQKWRRPRGRHSKIRRKRFGYPIKVMIGFKRNQAHSGLIEGLKPILVYNVQEMSKLAKNSMAIIAARVGARKKLEMIKKAQEMGIKILNTGGKK